MLADHERVIRDLKIHLQSKDSHGRRELLTKIGELEAQHSIDEGTLERALRVSGNKLSEELLHYPGLKPAGSDAVGDRTNGSQDRPVVEA